MWMWHPFFRSDDIYLEDAEEDIATKCGGIIKWLKQII